MKLSLKQRVLIYTVMNFGTFFFSAIAAIQGRMSLERGLIIWLASALWINSLLWYSFKMRDKHSQ
jgi:hypothetical protein